MERPWLRHYPPGVAADIDTARYPSLVAMFEESFKAYAAREACVCMGKALTYAELDAASRAFAAWLQSRGLKPGARVALMMPNVLQYPVAIVGVLRAGCAVVNVNPLYKPRELEFQLNDSGAEAIVVLENFAAVLQEALPHTRSQARRHRQHGRHARRRERRDGQRRGAARQEDGAGLHFAGRHHIQGRACRWPQ